MAQQAIRAVDKHAFLPLDDHQEEDHPKRKRVPYLGEYANTYVSVQVSQNFFKK